MAVQEFVGITLTPLQKRIYDACELDSDYSYIAVTTGRQVGKTECTIQVCLNWCINHSFVVGYFEPVFKQAKKVFASFCRGLAQLEEEGFIEVNRTDLIIQFVGKGRIQFFTSETDTCRGFTFDAIVCDEAAFIKDEIFSSAILPTVAVSMSKGQGKVLLTSTPKSKNWFFDMSTIEMDNKISIKATSEEGGLISKEVLLQIKKTTPEHIYRNEYLAEFLDAGCGVFSYVSAVSDTEFEDRTSCVAGIDFGMENDYTVLAIMNVKGELVYLERWRDNDWSIVLTKIAEKLKEYKVIKAFAETNGIGNMPAKELKKKFAATTNWVTSNKSKVDIINKLSADFKQDLIKIPNRDYLLNELDAYTLDYTPATGKVTYGARSGFNDDCVMALAIANFNRIPTERRFAGSIKLNRR